MDPRNNPFAPGAGTRPPELAGRDSIISEAEIALARVMRRKAAKSQMLLGLRGVGKTVLLNRIAETAEVEGFETILLEAPEHRGLAEMLIPPLRKVLFKLSRQEKAKQLATRGLGVLRAFAETFKFKVGDIEFSVGPEQGTADSGHLEADLPELLFAVLAAIAEAERGVALFIDEVQYLKRADLAALIVSAHKVAQKGLPFIVFGAGLPQLAGLAGEAKSYAERLFDYPDVGPLTAEGTNTAIVAPLKRERVEIDQDALDVIFQKTQGYPYFLQEWGSHAWNTAEATPITKADAEAASVSALLKLDGNFFRVRLDRLTRREKDYMRSMASLGAGPHRSGEIAQELGVDVTTAGPLRNGLIKKGMVWSPHYGDTAFTVPMFDEFMRRSMSS